MRVWPLAWLTACSFVRGGGAGSDAVIGDVSGDGPRLKDAPADRALDAVSCLAPPSGLVAFWPAEGDARDVIGGHDGALVDNATATAQGKVGSAFGFDGNLDQVTIASPPAATKFTIEAWIDIAITSGYATVYADVPRGMWMRTGLLTWWEGSEVYTSSGTAAAGAWHHVALTYDGLTFAGYIDGIAQGTSTFAGASLPASGNTGIGGHNNEYVTGKIDEVSVYSRALSPSEVAAIALAGAGGKCHP